MLCIGLIGGIIHERKLTKWHSLFGSEPCFLMQHKRGEILAWKLIYFVFRGLF